MSAKSTGKKAQKDSSGELRGVIDQIEGDFAVVVFDDDQRLDWPRRYLPENTRAGAAVIVRVASARESNWSGESDASGYLRLDKQSLKWPTQPAAGKISLSIEVDAADTAARQERVRGLVNDIFKKSGDTEQKKA